MSVITPAEVLAISQEPKNINATLVEFVTSQFTDFLALKARRQAFKEADQGNWHVIASTYDKAALDDHERAVIVKAFEDAGWLNVKIRTEYNPYAPIIYYHMELDHPTPPNQGKKHVGHHRNRA